MLTRASARGRSFKLKMAVLEVGKSGSELQEQFRVKVKRNGNQGSVLRIVEEESEGDDKSKRQLRSFVAIQPLVPNG